MIQLATIPKSTKSAQIRNYVAANPKAKPQAIADALGVKLPYVYTVMWNTKKKAKVAKKLGGMQKKKAMTNKELVDLSPALKFLEGRAQARKEEWETISISSSNTPMQVEMFEPKADPVNHPAHYKVGGIETIDFIEAKKLGYNLGNVIKYLTRADHKGNKLEDLRKAQWYLTREINSLK